VAGSLAEDSAARQPAGSERVTGPSGQAYHARAIETIRTGQRVLAQNPQLTEEDLPDVPVDPASWVNIHLRMSQATGDPLEITLLRPVEWLAAQLAETAALDAEYPQALEEARGDGSALEMTDLRSVILSTEAPQSAPGGIPALSADQTPTTPWIFLALHELAAVGPAEVVEVSPCPELEPGAGRLVTGTFFHHSGEVLDIAVDGLTEPIGCTGAHPFWSEDRQDFIPARNLVLGETLRTESGTLRQITRITPRRGPPVPVFNLEVDAEHVYYVSVDGVLVHNAYGNAEFVDTPNSNFRGGKHGDMKFPKGDGLDSNHSPADAISLFRRDDGPAFQMEPRDHRRMSSTGSSKEAKAWRQRQQFLIAQGKLREAVQMDIDEARRLFGEKYDPAIQEMLDYITSLGY
jgi:hypothetical protein